MTEPRVAAALAAPQARQAVADGRYGQVIRCVRRALNLKQSELGDRIGYSQSIVSRIESGAQRVSRETRLAVADALGIPLAALGLSPGPFTADRVASSLHDVNRRDTLRGLFGAAVALAFPRVLTAEAPRVTSDDVAACRRTLGRLLELDSEVGGGHVATLNDQLVTGVRRLISKGVWSAPVGNGLREVLAGGLENAGWLAYDAGDHDVAYSRWLEALHAADMGRYLPVRTVALASMSLQAASLGRGNDAVQLAQVAARDPQASGRVRSLLAAREGLGEAHRGDRAAALRAFAAAERLLESAEVGGDPAWISFWGPADLRSHQVQASAALGDLAPAERAAVECLAAPECAKWGRNRALYSIRLGMLLARRRAVDEAIDVLSSAITSIGPISSGRVVVDARAAVRQVSRHSNYEPARTFTAWAGQMLAMA